jgi:23S rRNA (cytidine1920-2'-O)/16S rRNA (cytidine1409-2'-O)-methyltransferase
MSDGPRSRSTVRLDQALVDRGVVDSRARARALILAGRVRSKDAVLDKPGRRIPMSLPLDVDSAPRDVGRGASKLRGALERLSVDFSGRVVLDVGASTGGFTQVALESGALCVVAVDVGRGQLDWTLRKDPRVEAVEGVNARYLEPDRLPRRPDRAVIDVSFISLRKILPAVGMCLPATSEVVMLVKPQFEVGRGQVGRGGIVRERSLHREALTTVVRFACDLGWRIRDTIPSPITGARGNVEFFVHLVRGQEIVDGPAPEDLIDRAVDEAHDEVDAR